MARIPTVGAKKLNVAQLTPQVRKILARRSRKAAHREYAPVIAADRRAFGTANRAYQLQKQSVHGATTIAENELSQALRGLRGSGLKGGYLRQVQNEITSRQADVASSIPALLAEASRERSSAIRDARTELLKDQAQKQQSAASTFNQLLKEERGHASTLLGKHSGPSASEKKSLENAAIALHGAISAWLKDPELQAEAPLKTNADWVHFAEAMVKNGEGFSAADAIKVISRLRKHWAVKGVYGQLNPFG